MNQSFEIVISNLKTLSPSTNLQIDWHENSFDKIKQLMSMKNNQGDGWLHFLSHLLNQPISLEDYHQISEFLIFLIEFSYSLSFRDVPFMNNLINEKNFHNETFLSILAKDERPEHNDKLISQIVKSYFTFINFDNELKPGIFLSQIIEHKIPNLIQKTASNCVLTLYPDLRNEQKTENKNIFFSLPPKNGKNAEDHNKENQPNDTGRTRPSFFSDEVL